MSVELYKRHDALISELKLDFESLYIFANMMLDQLGIVAAYVTGAPEPEKWSFHQLAMSKGDFVNIQQKFFRVFGLTKLTFLLAFTIAGYNVACIRSFKTRMAADAEARGAKKKHRATRRKGTYAEILGDSAKGPGPDPPPD